MITGLIITLFLIQLIMIFIIVLLNSKISKFKDLEIRQNQLIDEMDNTISVYLLEMKEENDRLIKELKQSNYSKNSVQVQGVSSIEIAKPTALEKSQPAPPVESVPVEHSPERELRQYVPVKLAVNAYSKQKAQMMDESKIEAAQEEQVQKIEEPKRAKKEQTYEQQVVELYQEGKSIEEIAKLMQRGKTEIELLIKFHA